jgi:CheY-like chemotaxis protein
VKDGHEVVAVASGNELLALLESSAARGAAWAFDLVVTDMRMPGRSGLEILRSLSQSAAAPPFVLITAFGSEELHEEAQQLGVAATLDKPFDLDDLRRTIDTVLAD